MLIKGDIQTQLKDVFKVRTKLLKALEKDSGLKIKKTSLGKTVYELEPTIVKDFDFNEKDILSNLMELASYEPEMECSDIPYSVIFDDTVLKKIKDTKFRKVYVILLLLQMKYILHLNIWRKEVLLYQNLRI